MYKIYKTVSNNQMRNRYLAVEFISILVVLMFMLSGCSLPVRQSAVPQQLTEKAEVVGMPGIRYVVRAEMPGFTQDAMESYYREQAYLAQQGQNGSLPLANFLALSGGGDNGAFGSGLLAGWTATGNRPEFKTVTGISTGGLIAPFAFLGPKYDSPLKEVFTSSSPRDILEMRSFLAAVFDDALADNAPLARLLNKYVTEDMLKEIAREHAKGRLLSVDIHHQSGC
ncbi:MAG TPA: patatin-like phospholipase family protein [Methylobacter sp.]